jgi:hypothetical protein
MILQEENEVLYISPSPLPLVLLVGSNPGIANERILRSKLF